MQQSSMRLIFTALVAACVLSPPSVAAASLLRHKAAVVPKKDVKIKNPMKHSVGDVIADVEPPSPRGQQYSHVWAPVSPPAARDISPTDPGEIFHGWEGDAAQVLDSMSADQQMKFEGSTCDSVCAACSIFAAQQEGGCYCYATCKMGECGMGGAMPHIGWSNNEVSTPKTVWQATCNIGTKNCEAECMKDSLKKQLNDCSKETGNPADCYNRLSQLHKPLPLDARKQVHYCVKKHMKTCDTFRNAPQEGGWICYSDASKCEEKVATGFKIPMTTWEAPSVWQAQYTDSR